VLVGDLGQREKPRTEASREDDALHGSMLSLWLEIWGWMENA
jgi:hypothetical protein